MRIHDDRFRRTLARRFLGRSRLLDGATLEVLDYSDVAGLEVRISGAISVVLAIAWVKNSAHVLPGSPCLRAADLDGLETAFDDCVRRFLSKHHFVDATGRSTRRSIA